MYNSFEVQKGDEKFLHGKIMEGISNGETQFELLAPLGVLQTAQNAISQIRSSLIKQELVMESPMPSLGETENGTKCTVIKLEVTKPNHLNS